MNGDYKKFLLIIGVAFLLIALVGLQISFVNLSFLNLNLFLILVLYLVLVKNNSKALIFAWLGGFLTGQSSFSNFGINSLILLILAAVLIIFYKTALLIPKTGNIFVISIAGIAFYHFLNWLLTGFWTLFKTGVFENLGGYFLNSGILIELVSTILLLLIIFKFKTNIGNA